MDGSMDALADLGETFQDIRDLMANEPVRIVIEGEVGNVDGTLYLRDPDVENHRWMMVGSALGQVSADVCLLELVRQTLR